jgi:glutamate 5-kinase
VTGSPFDDSFDEDTLSAETAIICQAHKLVLLSYVDGLFTSDPKLEPTATRVPLIEHLIDSHLNTTGLGNKLKAAKITQDAGIDTIIISPFSFAQNFELGTLVKGRKVTPLLTLIKEELNAKGLKAK